MKKIVLMTLLSLAAAGLAHAEKADSDKAATITAQQGTADEVKQTRNLKGNVVLVKGTLTMKAGRALLTEDPQGYQFVTFWADPGKLATFRQKRDGEGDLWVEGEAERVEYDSRTEVVKLFSKAKMTRLAGSKATESASGAFISYDSRKEQFQLENSASGETSSAGGNVTMVIEAKKPAAQPAAAVPAPGKK